MIKCRKCDYQHPKEVGLHLHHIVPKFMGGRDIDGRLYLCKKCHDIIHKIIPKWMWNSVGEKQKDGMRKDVSKITNNWVKND